MNNFENSHIEFTDRLTSSDTNNGIESVDDASNNSSWSPESWRTFPVKQNPSWQCVEAVNDVEKQLSGFPPLVFAGEVDRLTSRIADVSKGEAILLQGGDCAESFAEHSANNIRDFLSVFLQMSAVITYGAGLPVVKVGRIAGQFAKPRSSDEEVVEGITLPSYRGDIINSIEFDAKSRIPDPKRQLEAYRQSAATLNLIRALSGGGYASLQNAYMWIRQYVQGSEATKRYETIANHISHALSFMKACGVNAQNTRQLAVASIYTSHEALLLGYEQALTRRDYRTGKWYATSGHFLWIGDRTRQLDGAHVEFCRGIENPIGIKCGPTIDADELLRIIDKINPDDAPGKITLICRMGAEKVAEKLPKLIKTVRDSGKNVAWTCDPMHGNTEKTRTGYKTRRLDNVISELDDFFAIHKAEGTFAGGVHLEMTGQNVTECIGGANLVEECNVGDRYHTYCDPRLNSNQSLDVAFYIAEALQERKNNY